MKKVIVTLMALAMTFSFVACGNNNTQSSASLESTDQQPSSSQSAENSALETTEAETGKTLVAYFSHSGNTRAVAENIHASVGGDIFEIKTIGEYPTDYNQVMEMAQKEKSDNARMVGTIIYSQNSFRNWCKRWTEPLWNATQPMAVLTQTR